MSEFLRKVKRSTKNCYNRAKGKIAEIRSKPTVDESDDSSQEDTRRNKTQQREETVTTTTVTTSVTETTVETKPATNASTTTTTSTNSKLSTTAGGNRRPNSLPQWPPNKNGSSKPTIARNPQNKIAKPAAARQRVAPTNKPKEDEEPFANADPAKWSVSEHQYCGSFKFETLGKTEKIKGKSIQEGIQHFKDNPLQYVAIQYQSSMIDWPTEQQCYEYIHREGTSKWEPQGISPDGWMTVLKLQYQRLPAFPDHALPARHRDKYTDGLLSTFAGKRLRDPLLPGRGMGVVDAPHLKIIGDVDPSDIAQGQVGNCWMLSGISSLAEFDGAVKRLFRKTKGLDEMPRDGPNMYTVTLWDLNTWKEVDIQVDERLCAAPGNGSGGRLLSSKPSEDGELWVCYLEKALAAHCGGWDKIVGGQCTHAWALMTGCKEQYTISKNKATGKYQCCAKFDPYKGKWARHANSPHDCDGTLWNVPWPDVGGGGTDELDEEELFMRMCAWDDTNYIVGAGTAGTSDKNTTGGMVDNHAYSVIEARNDVAGTDVDLIKVRNPWGRGEIEDGKFDDDGPGWDMYPQIKRELNPVVADDGIFWVTKQEFFQLFKVIYLSASDMTEFLED